MFRAFQLLSLFLQYLNFRAVGKSRSVLRQDAIFNMCFSYLWLSYALLSFAAKDDRVFLCCLRWIRVKF